MNTRYTLHAAFGPVLIALAVLGCTNTDPPLATDLQTPVVDAIPASDATNPDLTPSRDSDDVVVADAVAVEPPASLSLGQVVLKRIGEPTWQVTQMILVNATFGNGVEAGTDYQGFFRCAISPFFALNGDQVIPVSQPLNLATMTPIGAGRVLSEHIQRCLLSRAGEPWEPAFSGQNWGASLDFGPGRGVMLLTAIEPTDTAPRGRSAFGSQDPLITNAVMPITINTRTAQGGTVFWQDSHQLAPINTLTNTADPGCQSDPLQCPKFDADGFTGTFFTTPVLAVDRDPLPSLIASYTVDVQLRDATGQGYRVTFPFSIL